MKETVPAKLKLFYVRADNSDGENLDLMVVAQNKEQVRKIWSDHFEIEDDDDEAPAWIGVVPGVTPACEPGVIEWEAIRMD